MKFYFKVENSEGDPSPVPFSSLYEQKPKHENADT